MGGYVTDAFSGVDAIIGSEIPINSIIEGYAASAATFLSVVCNRRYITKHSSVSYSPVKWWVLGNISTNDR